MSHSKFYIIHSYLSKSLPTQPSRISFLVLGTTHTAIGHRRKQNRHQVSDIPVRRRQGQFKSKQANKKLESVITQPNRQEDGYTEEKKKKKRDA